MDWVLIAGLCFGATVGLLHAIYVIATRAAGPARLSKTLWRGAWILLLWTAFGTYVLAFWLIGAVLLGLARAISALRAPGAAGSETRS